MTDKIIIISHLVVMSRIYYYIILDTIFLIPLKIFIVKLFFMITIETCPL